MLNCREVSQLASEALDRKLTLKERIGLRFHLMMCKLCTRYVRQLKFMHHACSGMDENQVTATDPRLSETARNRIRNQLDRRS